MLGGRVSSWRRQVMDANGLRTINDTMGEPSGSGVPIVGARALHAVSPESYSVHGELIVPGAAKPNGIQAIAAEVGLHSGEVADNFPDDAATRWRLDNLSTTGASKPLDELIGQEIELQYWRCAAVEIMDPKNGEVTRVPRTVLVTRDGQLLHAASIGVFQVVSSLARTFGRDELPKGFKLRVAEIKTRMGYRMLTLQAV